MEYKIKECSFTNEQKETIDYVEVYLSVGEVEIRLKPFDDEERKKFNRTLRDEGYKIGK